MDILVKCELPSASGLGEDKFTNTFSFTSLPNLDSETLDAVTVALENFYNAIPNGGLVALKDLMSPEIDNTVDQARFSVYDLTGHLGGTPTGSPIYSRPFTLLADAGDNGIGLPAEVAYVITLEGEGREGAPVELPDGADPGVEVDRPKQRRTGRIYLGPLNTDCLAVVDGIVRPHASLRDTVPLCVQDLQDLVNADTFGGSLAVWSRKDATMYPVRYTSVDNSFDTMRSRGGASTVRTRTFTPA